MLMSTDCEFGWWATSVLNTDIVEEIYFFKHPKNNMILIYKNNGPSKTN